MAAEQWRRLEDAILRHAGMLDVSVRQSLATGQQQIPDPLEVYMNKVSRYAYRVTDDDVRAVRASSNLMDRVVDALGFDIPESFARGAASQLKRGYKL